MRSQLEHRRAVVEFYRVIDFRNVVHSYLKGTAGKGLVTEEMKELDAQFDGPKFHSRGKLTTAYLTHMLQMEDRWLVDKAHPEGKTVTGQTRVKGIIDRGLAKGYTREEYYDIISNPLPQELTSLNDVSYDEGINAVTLKEGQDDPGTQAELQSAIADIQSLLRTPKSKGASKSSTSANPSGPRILPTRGDPAPVFVC